MNYFSTFINLVNKGNTIHKSHVCYAQRLHATPSLHALFHAPTCSPNQELQQLFIDKHLQGIILADFGPDFLTWGKFQPIIHLGKILTVGSK
jgi:hypothetical protein